MKRYFFLGFIVLMGAFLTESCHSHKGFTRLKNSYGPSTTLLLAAKNGDIDAVKKLIKVGANVNEQDTNGISPLYEASRLDYADIAKYLLSHGAQVDIKNRKGTTPLTIGVLNNSANACAVLLDKGANKDEVDSLKITLLDRATYNDNLPIVKLLVEHGCDVNKVDRYYWAPIIYAAGNGHVEILKYLIKNGADKNYNKTSSGRTPIHFAAYYGALESIDALLDAGVNIDYRDKDSSSPLNMIMGPVPMDSLKRIATVKHLIEKGADVNAKDKNGNTPIHLAAEQGYTEIAKMLLDHGALINERNKKGETALHLAVKAPEPHSETVAFLIERKANINQLDNNGNSPLDVVPFFKAEDITRILLMNGALHGGGKK